MRTISQKSSPYTQIQRNPNPNCKNESPTMPRKGTSRPAAVSRSRLIAAADLSSDDDFAQTQATMLPSPDSSDIKVAAPAPPPRARSSAKPSSAAARSSKTAGPDARSKKRVRPALSDLTNVADDVSDPEPEPERKRAKPATTTAAAAAKKSKVRKPAAAAARRGKKADPVPADEEEEEQEEDVHASVEQIDESIEESHVAPLRSVAPAPPPTQATAGYSRARSASRQPDGAVAGGGGARRHRAGSASSVERAGLGDPALRRRLGELQNKFDVQQARYQSLKEVATVEAQTNFERLKAAADAKAKCGFWFLSGVV
jgi:hypothetical protein